MEKEDIVKDVNVVGPEGAKLVSFRQSITLEENGLQFPC